MMPHRRTLWVLVCFGVRRDRSAHTKVECCRAAKCNGATLARAPLWLCKMNYVSHVNAGLSLKKAAAAAAAATTKRGQAQPRAGLPEVLVSGPLVGRVKAHSPTLKDHVEPRDAAVTNSRHHSIALPATSSPSKRPRTMTPVRRRQTGKRAPKPMLPASALGRRPLWWTRPSAPRLCRATSADAGGPWRLGDRKEPRVHDSARQGGKFLLFNAHIPCQSIAVSGRPTRCCRVAFCGTPYTDFRVFFLVVIFSTFFLVL